MICKKCNRVKLRAEEEVNVWVRISKYARVLRNRDDIIGHAIEDSKREHICRPKSLNLNEGLALLLRGRYNETTED